MRKVTKIALIVVGSVVGAAIIALISVDIWASRVANNTIQYMLSKVDKQGQELRVGDIHVGLLTGMIDVTDIYLATDTDAFDTSLPRKKPGMEVYVPHVTLELVNYYELIRHRRVKVFGVTVHHPHWTVWLDEKHPERCLPVFPKDTIDISQKLSEISVNRVRLTRATGELKSVRTSLYARTDSLSAEVKDLHFDCSDKVFSYNDSAYALSADNLFLRLPDGSKEMRFRDLETKDSGPVLLGESRIRDLFSNKKMADRAKEPISWIDLTINRLETSPINPIRKAIAQDWTLDSLYVDVRRMHTIRDERYVATKPYPIPQDVLMKIPAKFAVKNVKAYVDEMFIEVTMNGEQYGQLTLNKIDAQLSNVTNRRNALWTNAISAPIGKNGRVRATFAMYMNKEGTFDCEINGTDIELSFLNPFIRPLVGLSFDSHVDKLETTYCGNRIKADGDFLMMYHGLTVTSYPKEKAALREVQKHAKTIENLANSLVPKSNPTAVDPAPRRYMVTWKRDETKPYPLYVFGPCINGVIETMLPGLYAHKQIR